MAAAELVQRLPLPVLLCLLLLVLCLLVHNGCKADTSTGYPGCPHGGVWETSVEKCFMVLKSDHGESGYESVYEAAMECRSVGAMIASVETEAVRKTVTELIEQPTNRHAFEQVYIGLNDIKKENDFTWFDGSHHHRNRDTWDLGEPNTGNYAYEEDCVVLRMMKRHKKSHWHDYPCCTSASIKGVLCQMDRQQLEEEQSGTSNTKMRFPEVELLAKTCNINRCSSIECLNGGSCVNEEGSYWCRCPLGYSGALCENDVDECLEATCLNNATCVNLVGKFQCVCGKDFVGPSCETAICPEVVVIENSESEGQLLAEGSTVSYACNPGYSFPLELSGQTRIELVCSGHKWAIAVQGNIVNYSLDLLQCRPICDEPLSFNNSRRTEVSLYEGRAVNYTCNEMFDFVGEFKGQDFVGFICSEHKWRLIRDSGTDFDSIMTPNFFVCEPICDEPLSFNNSWRTEVSLYEGSAVSYTCNEMFDFAGEFKGQDFVEFKCSEHKWRLTRDSGTDFDSVMKPNLIVCEPICDEPLSFNNSWRTEVSLYEGSAVNYTCNETFDFAGEFKGQEFVEFICSEHKWRLIRDSGTQFDSVMKPNFIVCEPICDEPHSFNNSWRTGGSLYEGSAVSYTCNEMFDFAGEFKGQEFVGFNCSEHKWRLIRDNGTDFDSIMKPNFIVCEPICDEPLSFNNSWRTEVSLYEGSAVNYTCNETFDFAGEFKGQEFVGFICSEHKWRLTRDSGTDFDSIMQPNFIVCEPVCPQPITLANSTRTGNSVSEGSTVRYTCEYGFRFPKRLNFLELKCERHNWTIVVQSEEENTTESYDYDTCRPSLKHSEQDKNGFPQCQAILCPPFPTWKGIRTENESRMVGAIIHYNCTERKQFVVDANKAFQTSECLLNETWIPDFQRCKYSDEELAKKIEPKEARGAVAIGTVAIVFLSLELALVVLMDIDHLIRHAKMLKENVASGFRRLIGAKQ